METPEDSEVFHGNGGAVRAGHPQAATVTQPRLQTSPPRTWARAGSLAREARGPGHPVCPSRCRLPVSPPGARPAGRGGSRRPFSIAAVMMKHPRTASESKLPEIRFTSGPRRL